MTSDGPPSPRGRRVAVLVNPAAGSAGPSGASERIRAAFARAGAQAHVADIEAEGLARTVRALVEAGFDTIVAAGGDGTISSVARHLVHTTTRFGVLPLGTLNHFARDVGIPLELDAAIEVVLRGTARPIDVGSVNGRTFLNNASLGLYPDQVRMRARLRGRLGKWAGAFVAGLAALRRWRLLWITVEADGARHRVRCPMTMVGNGVYGILEGVPSGRARLDAATLSLHLFTEIRRLGLVLCVLRVMMGKASTVRRLETSFHHELTIHTNRRRVPIALDGEVTTLVSPLRFRSLPGALSVLARERTG